MGLRTFMLLLLLPLHAFAAPDPPPLEAAGGQPTPAQAQAAVMESLRKTAQDPKDLERTRFLSGPHLVTGITLAGNRENAWQMCVIVGEAKLSHNSPELEVKPFFLRQTGAQLTVLPVVNWKSYDSKC
jgi:hypothetical protein